MVIFKLRWNRYEPTVAPRYIYYCCYSESKCTTYHLFLYLHCDVSALWFEEDSSKHDFASSKKIVQSYLKSSKYRDQLQKWRHNQRIPGFSDTAGLGTKPRFTEDVRSQNSTQQHNNCQFYNRSILER